MNSPLYYLEIIFNLNTRLYNNSLEGVTEENSAERISDHNNSFKWIATHTVWARYNTLMFLGKPAENPYPGLFENFRAYDAGDKFPSLEELKAEWKKVSGLLSNALSTADESFLMADSPFASPIGDPTNMGTLTFFAEHESYDIGQMGFVKKYLTKEAMSYK